MKHGVGFGAQRCAWRGGGSTCGEREIIIRAGENHTVSFHIYQGKFIWGGGQMKGGGGVISNIKSLVVAGGKFSVLGKMLS